MVTDAPTMTTGERNYWPVAFRRPMTGSGGTWEGPLVAYWEVHGDPISDEYTPDEISAEALLGKWAEVYGAKEPNGLVPIRWYISSKKAAKFETMPFTYQHGWKDKDDFLTYYGWPLHADTGERLNWLVLPVEDKLWRPGRADKGGFIQEATGWKPAIGQPFVYLPALLRCRA